MSPQDASSCYTRRAYLSVAAATTTAALAGCVGGDNGDDDDGGGGDDGNSQNQTDEPETTLEILETEYFVREGVPDDQPALNAVVANDDDSMANNVRLEVDFLDSGGDVLGSSLQTLPVLPGGDEWFARAFSTTANPSRVDDYEAQLSAEHVDYTVPFEVQEVELTDETLVGSGQFQGDEQTHVELIGLVYSDGRIVADSREHTRELTPEEEWEFELSVDWGILDRVGPDSEIQIVPIQAGTR